MIRLFLIAVPIAIVLGAIVGVVLRICGRDGIGRKLRSK